MYLLLGRLHGLQRKMFLTLMLCAAALAAESAEETLAKAGETGEAWRFNRFRNAGETGGFSPLQRALLRTWF